MLLGSSTVGSNHLVAWQLVDAPGKRSRRHRDRTLDVFILVGGFGAGIDDYSSALRLDPKLAGALYGRGLARLKQGDKAGGDADISAAKTIQGNIGDDFTRYGVR